MDGFVLRQPYPIGMEVDTAQLRLHQMGQPLAADVALDEAGTSLLNDGAKGSFGDPDTADEIWGWRQADDGYWLNYLFDSDGSIPTFDGAWFDQVTALPTTMTLDMGTGWWYRSKADGARAGSPAWIWTEPVPY